MSSRSFCLSIKSAICDSLLHTRHRLCDVVHFSFSVQSVCYASAIGVGPMSVLRKKNFVAILTCVGLLALLSACGHEPVRRVTPSTQNTAKPAPAVRKPRQSVGEQAAIVASRQIGVPYVYGGSTENGFDCSGLVQYAYANVGKRIPRTTSQQWQSLRAVAAKDLRVGDLLFFRIGGKISHVGLYLGNRRFVHAPSTGRRVSVESLNSSFYSKTFVRAGRP